MTSPENPKPKQVPFNELLASVVRTATEPYIAMLHDSEDDERLSADALNGVRRQIDDLNRLDTFLSEFDMSGVRHVITDRSQRTQMDDRGAIESFLVRYGRAGERLPYVSEGTAQEQLSMQAIKSSAFESELDTINALSLQGRSAENTLSRVNTADRPLSIIVNTMFAARGYDGKVVIAPNAGVRFLWMPGMPEAVVNGVKFVGKAPHYMAFEHMGISNRKFGFLFNAIQRLSSGTIRNTKPATAS